MHVFRDVMSLREFLDSEKESGNKVGFVPTMGALHTGHLALIDAMNEACETGVVSIFVNPKQFNVASDLDSYPRPIEEDIRKLVEADCDVLFMPSADEVYPKGLESVLSIDLAGLDESMEGKYRPGHFQGVAQVMFRLLHIVQPDVLFMGQKDFQQTVIVRHMISLYGLPVEFELCPTIREEDGLAMSSRNVRLTPENRQKAIVLYQELEKARLDLGNKSVALIKGNAMQTIAKNGGNPEYFDIVDGDTLEAVEFAAHHEAVVACTAAWFGDVRLIDNVILKQEK